jgi:Ca-activated chloride channel family protein
VPPNDQPYADVFFEEYGVNPFVDTEDDHLSTFAVDVDTASYTVMRRYVEDGYLPPDESVRVEEYVNFFEQDYAPPVEDAFAIHLEGAPSLYGGERYHLARVGLQGYTVPPEERADVVLTFVIDVSGSMDMENRLELVKDALWLLVQELRPTDRVGIVVYGSRARTVLEHTPVEEGRHITRAIDRLRPEGSTNAEEGLTLAYQLARRAFDPAAVNRVILCSDGVANVGRTGPDSILERIRAYAEQEIYLTTVGFGMGNYNDVLMEQLADNGDGFYAYVDTLKEAERVFVHDLTSTLQVIARDAKVQVDFNPAVVSRYRLLGYENRDVADEDFRNDAVDAGEIGPGHSVTALYELKFHPEAPAHEVALTVHMRYEDPDSGEVRELSRAIAQADFVPAFEEAPIRFQLDAVVAEYAEILRHSYWAQDSSMEDVAREAARVAEYLPQDKQVAEFADLVRRASRLTDVVTE